MCMPVQTKSLVALEELLQEIRPKYLRPKHFIRVKGAKMSEQEKDEFDAVSCRRSFCPQLYSACSGMRTVESEY